MSSDELFETLAQITPEQLSGYLSLNGWVEDAKIRDIASIWHRPSDEDQADFEILKPDVRGIKDYVARVNDLIRVLSVYEQRKANEVFNDIVNLLADVVHIRVVHEDIENGSIPLEDGILLFEKARDLFISATLSSLNKKKFFSGNRSNEVLDLIDKARLGQTEVGSYVINIIAPLEDNIDESPSLYERVSFSRVVTTTLASSLGAVMSSIQEYRKTRNPNVFDRAVEDGLSANLCDALIGLTGQKNSRDVDIYLSFSKSQRPLKELKTKYSFKSEIVPYLSQASEYLKGSYIKSDFEISGFVKKLDREKDSDDGSITVTTFVDGKERNVVFDLPEVEYLEAIHAHESRHVVECVGNLHVSPRSCKLFDVRAFRVIRNGELFD